MPSWSTPPAPSWQHAGAGQGPGHPAPVHLRGRHGRRILPAGAIARHGRRAAFLAGTGCGVLVGLLAALAVVLGSFWLFCLGTFFGGAYAAVVLSFRFAAADGVSPSGAPAPVLRHGRRRAGRRGRAAAGHAHHVPVARPYVRRHLHRAGGVAAASALVLLGVRLPMPGPADAAGGRPLAFIARQPRFVTAVVCGAVSC